MPALIPRSPDELGDYRLSDQQRLMPVRPVVIGGETVTAVGFVLRQGYANPAYQAVAVQLQWPTIVP
jgi:hypothetical protein